MYLVNLILEKKHMLKLNSQRVCKKIHTKSFATKGILELCEYEKNTLNPEKGAELSFVSSGSQTNRIKDGMAGMFNLKANKSLLSLISNCDRVYPSVKQTLQDLCDFENFN